VQPTGTFVNDSLYAEVWHRQAELKNRVKATPPQSDIYAARAEDALGRQAGLEALLWLMEMDLAGGHPAFQVRARGSAHLLPIGRARRSGRQG
jgi:hypothetical protein